MKLLRFKLHVPFRSLAAGFEVHFLRERDHERCFEFHPYCLAGPNGSGKSNVLEALAAIFYHIECIYLNYRPDGFEFEELTNRHGFRAEHCSPDAFELEYFFPDETLEEREPWAKLDIRPAVHIRITKVAGNRPKFEWLNRADYEDTEETELTSRAAIRAYLPKFIIGYSSGDNEILSLPFLKMRCIHFDEYRDHLVKAVPYDGRSEGRMIYVDDQFSQAILLCHYLFPDETVKRVFLDKLGLEGIRCFRLTIRRHHSVPAAPERLASLTSEEKKGALNTSLELTSLLSGYEDKDGKHYLGLIDKLIKCSTTYFDEPGTDGGLGTLNLDYLVDDATRQAFQFHFGTGLAETKGLANAASALNLFQAFQTLLTLNYYQIREDTKKIIYRAETLFIKDHAPLPTGHARILRFQNLDIKKKGCTKPVAIRSLSDGEYQFLHTIGLCLLYRHESGLFLLDEPETHLNPDWRASYITTLREALEADAATKTVMREVLLTSHSPFIISDCQKENVLVFNKEHGVVTCDRPPDHLQTFGASATLITDEIFGRRETIGDFANEELKRIEAKKGQPGHDARQLARELDRTLGDSIEKTLAITRILENTQES